MHSESYQGDGEHASSAAASSSRDFSRESSMIPPRKPRGFRIALIIMAVLVALLALALFLLPYFLPVDTIRSVAKTQAGAYGLDVDFESLGFSWDGRVVLNGITVTPLDEPDNQPLFTADEVRTTVALSPLLRGTVVVHALDVQGFSVRLRRYGDGSLNLPDLASASSPAGRQSSRVRLSAPMAASAGASLPPVSIDRINLRNGIMGVVDDVTGLDIDAGLDFLTVEGGHIENPFTFSGRLLPLPGSEEHGEIPFSGRLDLVRNGAIDLNNGEANIEILARGVRLDSIAERLGLEHMVRSGQADGIIKLAYADASLLVGVTDLNLDALAVAMDGFPLVRLPSTHIGLNAAYRLSTDTLELPDLAVRNALQAIKAKGILNGIQGLADNSLPHGSLEFTGMMDFGQILAYAATQDIALPDLPIISGNGSYFGNAVVSPATGDGLPVSLSVDFNDGSLAVSEDATGISGSVRLDGIGIKAAATLGDEAELNANVSLTGIPVSFTIPGLGDAPITAQINGGAALTTAGEEPGFELRLNDTVVGLPATPWSKDVSVTASEARLVYHFLRDRLEIAGIQFSANDAVRGSIGSAVVHGLAAGQPDGQVDIELSAALESLIDLAAPALPDLPPKIGGALRSVTRLKVTGNGVESVTRAEIDQANARVSVDAVQSALTMDKATFGLSLAADLAALETIHIRALEARSGETTIQVAGKAGNSLAARIGPGVVQMTGIVDMFSQRAELASFSIGGTGISTVIGRGGRQVAGFESGVMQMMLAGPDKPAIVPISGAGDFLVTEASLGADNVVFYRLIGESRENSDFGSLRAVLGMDGMIGGAQNSILNINTAQLTAKPFAVNSRSRLDLGAGSLMLEYAARLAPSAMGSVLTFFNLPPNMLDEAAVSGSLAWNGSQLDSKGQVQGRLRLSDSEVNPFAMAHDISAAADPVQQTLALGIRTLTGNVSTAGGDAVVTLQAQPSTLLLSRGGSQGLLDIRLNGAAAQTRQLLLGVTGMVPQLREMSTLLYQSQVGGVYQAWVQISDNDSSSLSFNLGGVWQGAALRIGNQPYLAEAGNLSARLEGNYLFSDNAVSISRMMLGSDTAQAQAAGTLQARLSMDDQAIPAGLEQINVDLRFSLADLTRLPLVFPGVVPETLGLAGSMEGTFSAGGSSQNIRISEGHVNFAQFRANPSGMEVAIPHGRASFDATVSIPPAFPPMTGSSPFEALRIITVRDGAFSLTGAQLQGKAVNAMSGSFTLINGVLSLNDWRLQVEGADGSAAAANGTVDFNPVQPAARLQVAVRNFPLSLVNQEIADFFVIETGVVNLPAIQGQTAGVAFAGLSEDEILQTLQLNNFSFVTSPVVLHTGPVLSRELDKARGLMRQEVAETGKARVISFSSISGTVTADGSGVITIPSETPISLIGDNTGDFRAHGSVFADHTMNLEFLIAGKLENIIGFSLPNLIPNLRSGTDEQRSRFMERMNRNAAAGHYRVRLSGPLDNPDLSGIGEVAGRFLVDIFAAAPGQIIGGVVDLGKDAPGALLDAAGAILNPENVTNPSNIIKAPVNIGRGLGRMFGVGRGSSGQSEDEETEE